MELGLQIVYNLHSLLHNYCTGAVRDSLRGITGDVHKRLFRVTGRDAIRRRGEQIPVRAITETADNQACYAHDLTCARH